MHIGKGLATAGLATLALGLGGGGAALAVTSASQATVQSEVPTVHQDPTVQHQPSHKTTTASHKAAAGHKTRTKASSKKSAAASTPERCTKEITVVVTTGTGPAALRTLSNGCWKVVNADGASNPQFRKCSAGLDVVTNKKAPDFAMDDMSPPNAIKDEALLKQCSAHATGTGYEYMADRDGWLLVPAPHVKAYFAELYSADGTIDDLMQDWPAQISGHTVSPMINIGPDNPPAIHEGATEMLEHVPDHGYFGIYNSDWNHSMTSHDARAQAVASALNAATTQQT